MNCNPDMKRPSTRGLAILFLFASMALVCHVKAQNRRDYFPMHIGDKWTYKLTANNIRHWANQTVEIIDTTTIQQEKYFAFESRIYDLYYEPGRVYVDTAYYRKSINGDIVKYSALNNNEQLYYTFQKDSLYRPYLYCGDFVDPEKNKWRISLFDTAAIILIPSGVFKDCYYYSFDFLSNDRIVLTEFIALAPGIGFIFRSAEGDYNFIVGAYINGRLIGDTTSTSVQNVARPETTHYPALYQNYPNPFNHITHITYSVPDFWDKPIEVSIFDISGREVISFSRIASKRGFDELLWNGTGKGGKEVSNGIYIARLRSGSFSDTIIINQCCPVKH